MTPNFDPAAGRRGRGLHCRRSTCRWTGTTLPQGTIDTSKNHRRIHLQRLANPLAPYDVKLNPYLTIDVMPVDLTVFNGVDAAIGQDHGVRLFPAWRR